MTPDAPHWATNQGWTSQTVETSPRRPEACGAEALLARTPFAYFDLCFFEYCNFTCFYCRDSNEMMSKGRGRQAVDEAIQDFLEQNTAGVFKVSGYGEASLWPDLTDTLESW